MVAPLLPMCISLLHISHFQGISFVLAVANMVIKSFVDVRLGVNFG